jgi:hypothetical protein
LIALVPFPKRTRPAIKEFAPVPPLATPSVPVDIILASTFGRSAAARVLQVGAPAAAGPISTFLALTVEAPVPPRATGRIPDVI